MAEQTSGRVTRSLRRRQTSVSSEETVKSPIKSTRKANVLETISESQTLHNARSKNVTPTTSEELENSGNCDNEVSVPAVRRTRLRASSTLTEENVNRLNLTPTRLLPPRRAKRNSSEYSDSPIPSQPPRKLPRRSSVSDADSNQSVPTASPFNRTRSRLKVMPTIEDSIIEVPEDGDTLPPIINESNENENNKSEEKIEENSSPTVDKNPTVNLSKLNVSALNFDVGESSSSKTNQISLPNEKSIVKIDLTDDNDSVEFVNSNQLIDESATVKECSFGSSQWVSLNESGSNNSDVVEQEEENEPEMHLKAKTPLRKFDDGLMSSSTPLLSLNNQGQSSKPGKSSVDLISRMSPLKKGQSQSLTNLALTQSPLKPSKFSNTWSQSIKGKASSSIGIDLFKGKNPNQDNNTSTKIPSPVQNSTSKLSKQLNSDKDLFNDEDDEDDEDNTNLNNDFIDDEAKEVEDGDEDSMSEEERQFLEMQEIPEKGISLGINDTDDSMESEEDNEDDSFIVSDKSDSDNDIVEVDPKLSNKKNRRRIQQISESSDDEVDNIKNDSKSKNYRRIHKFSESDDEEVGVPDTNLNKGNSDIEGVTKISEPNIEIETEEKSHSDREVNVLHQSGDNDMEVEMEISDSLELVSASSKMQASKRISERLSKSWTKKPEKMPNLNMSHPNMFFEIEKPSPNEKTLSETIVSDKESNRAEEINPVSSDLNLNKSLTISENDVNCNEEVNDEELNIDEVGKVPSPSKSTTNHTNDLQPDQNNGFSTDEITSISKLTNLYSSPKKPDISNILAKCDSVLASSENSRKLLKEQNKEPPSEEKVEHIKKKKELKMLSKEKRRENDAKRKIQTAELAIRKQGRKQRKLERKKAEVDEYENKKIEAIQNALKVKENILSKNVDWEFNINSVNDNDNINENKKNVRQDNVFTESVVTPKKKKLKILKSSAGNYIEEPVTPKAAAVPQNCNGFKQSPITPKAKNFNISPMSIPTPKSKKHEINNRKRKRSIIEPQTILPKPLWTTSGNFFESSIVPIHSTGVYIPLSDVSSTTNFVVASFKQGRKDKHIKHIKEEAGPSSLSIAHSFKQNALYNNKIHRQTSKQLIQMSHKKHANMK